MNLSANKLKTLPSSIGNLTGLTSLALDANQLTCPPQRLARLPGGLRRILNWFKNEYPPLVKAQRALFGQRIKEQCEPFHTSFPNVYQSICALVPDPTREPIGAPVDLAKLDPAVVARMGRFVHSLHPGQPSVVDVEAKVLFGRIYGWMMLSPAFQAPTQLYAKDLIAIRLENWLDADDARFVHSMTKQQLFDTVAYADDQNIGAFVDLAAARVVAELWGKSVEEMVEWLPF